MFTMHPTLLVGPADWDPVRMPKHEFLGRIAALWRACDQRISGVILYGDARHHAELAYLTHFTPKLEPAIALLPRTGTPRLLVGGGVNMLAAAGPLTWIEELLPLRDAGATVGRWRTELGSQEFALLNGDSMPFGLRQSIATTLGAPSDMTETLAAAMRRKSARELALMREACATLDATIAAMRTAQRAAQGMTDVVLAGERVAHQRGAQDVRSLFGRDGTLAPFLVPIAAPADPLQVYVAVRHGGYWAEGFAVLSGSAQPAAAKARAVLDEALGLAKPGTPHRELARHLAGEIGPARRHPVIGDTFGGSIGLALPQPGCLAATRDGRFAAGETYTVRVGLTDSAGSAMVSAMVAITDSGHDLLWAGGDS
jgi:hypothetical protein